jgi:hypothetical protein
MPHPLKEKQVFSTSLPLVALDKLHVILVANDKGYWMKKEVNK